MKPRVSRTQPTRPRWSGERSRSWGTTEAVSTGTGGAGTKFGFRETAMVLEPNPNPNPPRLCRVGREGLLKIGGDGLLNKGDSSCVEGEGMTIPRRVSASHMPSRPRGEAVGAGST